MKKVLFFSTLVFLICSCNQGQLEKTQPTNFNFGWKFHLGDIKGAEQPVFSDKNWKEVRIPHDWSVEHSFTQENTAGATAFLPGGVGWYRKSFNLNPSDKDKTIWIEFDGVYNNSEVWINGHFLGKRPYGYIPFSYDLSNYLNYGDTANVLAVKADRSAYIDCRWYPGSGIYRKVRLITKNKVHIPQWGTFITTPTVTNKEARILVTTDVKNNSATNNTFILKTTIFFNNKEITSDQKEVIVQAESSKKVDQKLVIKTPKLWDTENPHLYEAKQEIIHDNKVLDNDKTIFGVRSFKFDPDKGFFLNGENMLIKGVCIHHDGGLVGAAVPKGVWKRRLQKLKDGGCNAIRTAHNPPSGEFLDLCDQMGFLVQDEAFDEWNNPKDKKHNYNQREADPLTSGYTEYFSEWSERDIKNMVLRDRNHPSIIMWSIGNEIEWTYPEYGASTGYWGSNKVGDIDYYWDEPPFSVEQIKKNFELQEQGNYDLAETAKNLSEWVRQIDKSRPVTANIVIPSVSNFSGYAEALDIIGLSYRQVVYDYCHKNYPNMVFLGTENWTQWHEWEHVLDRQFISGLFLWTGINYMGESRSWPTKGSGSGLLDFAGFEKPSYHLFKTLWTTEPHLYITTQEISKSPYLWSGLENRLVEKTENWAARQKWGWHNVNEYWNYSEGDSIAIEVYTNQPEVELFLNDRSLGIQKLNENKDRVLKWLVPFSKGRLTARAIQDEEVIEKTIQTAGDIHAIYLEADKEELKANGEDVVHITAEFIDLNGNPVKHINKEITFEIEGNARILGVDNGSPENVQDYQSNKIVTDKGKCLLIVQANLIPSELSIKAHSKEIESKPVLINIR